MKTRLWRLGIVFFLGFLLTSGDVLASSLQTASSYGGTFANWPTVWTALPAFNDPDDGLANERIDLVGDSNDPGFYVASNSQYVCFRIRVDDGAVTQFSDTILILIDGPDSGTNVDYAFMWDSQSNDQANHGLELGVPNVIGTTWGGTRMDDIDGNNAKKIAPPDFGLTNGDGYVRIVNNQSTTNFGTTAFVDFAISWSFLKANTTLDYNQTWNVQLGAIDNANDHNWINYDVAGAKSPTDPISWPGNISFGPTMLTLTDWTAEPSHVSTVAWGLAVLLLLVTSVALLRRNG
ncbi:MAG: hypothetical protein KA988_02340 [Longilinea sp.]|nr:hypothetical protein [Longilinea sp.]